MADRKTIGAPATTWRKSSRSTGQGNCVEVAARWRKSSRSTADGNCVEVAAPWRKSSRSTGNGACVEVAAADRAVAVRDSKDRTGPVLAFTERGWRGFIAAVKVGRFDL